MRDIFAIMSFYLVFFIAGAGHFGVAPVLGAATQERPSGSAKTPNASDQSENEADRKITQQIRQAVTKDDSLSTGAQNVTIVTRDGKVTLRGTVESDSEKQKIAAAAKKVSGVKNVDNLLTVKVKK